MSKERFDQIDNRLERLELGVEKLERGQEKAERNHEQVKERLDGIDGHISFLLKQLDIRESENQQQHRDTMAFIELWSERIIGRIEVLAEGIGVNRDKLEDHEFRISDLEAS